MPLFNRGTTVKCWRNVKDPDTGVYVTPAISMKITIYNPKGSKVVNAVTLTPDSAGKYSYAFETTTMDVGGYTVEYRADDDGVITILAAAFTLI